MRRLLYIAVLSTVLFGSGPAAALGIVEDQVICHMTYGIDPDTIVDQLGVAVIDSIPAGEYPEGSIYLLLCGPANPVDTVIRHLIENPLVDHVQLNYIHDMYDPSQTSQAFVDQTSQAFVDGVEPIDYYRQYAGDNLCIDSAQLICQGAGTVVAVIDGGIDISHPVFSGRLGMVHYDFVDGDAEPWVGTGLAGNHGTFIAGIITRCAPEASLMIVRCLGTGGSGTSFRLSQGIRFAAENGANVINMSFGTNLADAIIGDAITYAYKKGIVMAASAGNGGDFVCQFPASHACVMGIAAVDENDILAEFSNYGRTVTVTAPGVNVYGPLAGGDIWGWWSGTSFATAFASGLSAMVKAANPGFTPDEVKSKITTSAVDIDYLNPAYELLLGEGRVDFLKATYIPGDANFNLTVNVGDIVYLINYVFRDGQSPIPPEAGDVNCDDVINVGDAVFLVNYIFRQGLSPGCP